ncbi:glycoside hydrolase family 2 TIM barrel-domain containing protein [Pedobacter sp. SYSU D00535]|uniref:glycoside hydrolase family 2 TIM barrel-domain containing protein n=1 Tax=Pedobacter sp. SYSU D00535 TaxID=2810308 RepID=UPI001A9590C6|nr:glycoside hydrolase family 2 TIM barrel-domain containing protein [Pedobacter sp. SYSU D00535]
MKVKKWIYAIGLLVLTSAVAVAQSGTTKEVQYLSGTDVKNTKTWDFWVTGGRKSGFWTSIPVPSHWEQHGFGGYNYGRDYVTYGKNFRFNDEKGLYKYQFDVPVSWQGKDVYIVFEGSMTDTEVKINGKSAGPIHQGAFYRFKYNISDKLKYGQRNLLEVTVSKMSADKSVNNAERLADYWIFGGIYRPVLLEALPKEHIDWVSIDAKANGAFNLNVYLKNAGSGREVLAEIVDKAGRVVGTGSVKTTGKDSVVNLKTTVKQPALWAAETPNLYKVNIYLKNNGNLVYKTSEKFGFRTIEVRKQDGIYINGTKIKIKGVNRHVFWPEYGRATYPEADLIDVKLIKEMNMNAVRCSHYPPDANFLRVCDSLGLYVIDELAGWQKAYSTKVGETRVKEMVTRDANHPSILFWSNGNEGGHNKDLDDDFAKYDLSARIVIHAHHRPGNAINGIDCNHYEDYYSAEKIVADTNLYMPTEFLHAMHDGGGAAGLADMWDLHWNSKKGVGGFIWDFADEGIMRTDLNNMIDVNGTNAADGVVGPHREKEGSFHAIREIYSPVRISLKALPENFKGEIPVENRFNFTNLKECSFEWELLKFNKKQDDDVGYTLINKGVISAPDVAPVAKGVLKVNLPARWKSSDALAIRAYDPYKNEVYRWVWKVKSNTQLLEEVLNAERADGSAVATETDSSITLKANGISISLSKRTGKLINVKNEKNPQLSFDNGPVLASGNSTFTGIKSIKEGNDIIVEASYTGDMTSVRWKMQPSGWLEMSYQYSLNGKYPFGGISFDYPEGLVTGVKWLGKGPYRVWKNRLQGVTFDVFEKRYNNTQTGTSPWIFPEFKGYYSEVVWMELSTMEGKFTIASPDNDLFVRLFDFYAIKGQKPHPQLPTGNISFLDGIPPVGSKMGINYENVKGLGPSSDLNEFNGPIKRTLYFYFGIPKPVED